MHCAFCAWHRVTATLSSLSSSVAARCLRCAVRAVSKEEPYVPKSVSNPPFIPSTAAHPGRYARARMSSSALVGGSSDALRLRGRCGIIALTDIGAPAERGVGLRVIYWLNHRVTGLNNYSKLFTISMVKPMQMSR